MYEYDARLVRVVDGDTIIVDLDLGCRAWLHNERLRLAGIDTPEIVGGTAETRARAQAAKARTAALVGSVPMLRVKTYPDPDSFGRWIAQVWAGDVWVNQTLLDEGLADPYRR